MKQDINTTGIGFFIFMWVCLLMLPAAIIIYKLSLYLLENDFKEWHITILWSLAFPITAALFMLALRFKLKGDPGPQGPPGPKGDQG